MQKDKHTNDLSQNKMGIMPENKLLFNMALPMIIAMVIQALYNVVDSIYVSRISESAVTALSLAFPIQNLLIGFAVGIGVGVNSLLSKALGQGDRDLADRTAGNGIFLAVAATGLFILVGIFGTKPYFTMQSQIAETVDGGIIYTTICCVFSLGIFLEVLGERLLQASGRTVYTMITQGTGAIVNILLDPVFIFGVEPLGIPAMGMAGAATATVIGQWIAAMLAVIFNLKFNPDIRFSLAAIRPRKRVIAPILSVGVPAIVMNSIGSVMTFGMNQILQGFHETATGVFGVYFKLQSVFVMPVFGVNNATISIIAFNYGARKPERIFRTLKIACGCAMVIMLLGTAGFLLLPDVLLGLFQPSEEFLRIGRSALRIICLHFPLAAIGIALGASFQALGNGIYSTVTSLIRQLIALLPAAYLLSLSGNVTLVWWSFPIAEVISLTVTLLFFRRIYRQKVLPLCKP